MSSESELVSLPSGPTSLEDSTQPTPTAYNAIVVDDVNDTALLHGPGLRSIRNPENLPVQEINPPYLGTAILSWRWDGNIRQGEGSRNVASAVLTFSSFYKTLPVIAAYDISGETFSKSIKRPWICHEARLYRHNENRIVYVSSSGEDPAIPLLPYLFSKFGRGLRAIWKTGFAKSLFGLLLGDIGMSDVADLKYIIPPLTSVLVAAHASMSRNDYLLTAAMLCATHCDSVSVRSLRRDISNLTFDRYSFWTEEMMEIRTADVDDQDTDDEIMEIMTYAVSKTFEMTTRTILLDGENVGELNKYTFEISDYTWYKISISNEGEHSILNGIPMTDADREVYHSREHQVLREQLLGSYGTSDDDCPKLKIVPRPQTWVSS
ncbi:hypothetical protein QBC38DRAFT_514618 [Podospora fimiseda]|uniref:Uncharacterized protein n=1 Tax=Podospora fimiseda TaxID=252190 RepID=A0AAN7BJS4_9PEZI|nr:hypothetical protein QBC38DRAFT_514618 [Podospora fimiseda]